LLDALATLDADTVRELHRKLETATTHAPTRPHPLTPAGTPGWRLTVRLESLVDSVRDALDARHVPVPRVRRQRHVPGRWGNYALGGVDAFPTGLGSDKHGKDVRETQRQNDPSTS
jgi:hypothetical protein